MNKKIKFSIIICFLICNNLFGQKKYMQKADGKIIDSIEYEKLKINNTDRINKALPVVDITLILKEKLKEIRRNTDSIIYTYEWKFDTKLPEKIVMRETEENIKYKIGDTFKMPSLTTVTNKKIEEKDLNGKPTLINFWFTTCKPCIAEMPVLNRIENSLKDSVNFISICIDSKEQVEKFLKKHEFNFTHIIDARSFTDYLGIYAFPLSIFLDKNRVIKKIEDDIQIQDKDEEYKPELDDEKKFLEYSQKLVRQNKF